MNMHLNGRNWSVGVLRTVRAKITFLGLAALLVCLGISLPLELLTNRWEAKQVERDAFIKEITDLAPAVQVLLAAPGARDLLHSFFARLPRGEELYVLNPSGAVVASSNAELEGKSLEKIPHPLPADVRDLLAAATGSPAARTVTSSARNATELFVHLGGGDTLLAVVSPQAAMQVQHILLYHTLPLLLFGVGLLGTIFWFALDRIILKPLGLLSRSAEAVLSLNDESTGIIPSGLIPLDDLGEVLRLQNSMLLKLRENRLRFEQELHRRTFELEVSHQLAGHINYHTTYQDLVQEVLMHLRKVVDWDVAAGFVVEKGQARVWSRSQVPPSTSATEEVRHWMEEACLSAGGGQLQILSGLWNSMDWTVVDPGGPELERIHSHMAFPLRAHDCHVGVVILGNSRPNAYADHHARVIRDVLEHGLISVERIRRLVRTQTKRLESILQNMSVGVLFLDTRGQLMYINRRGEQYLANLQEATDNFGGPWRNPRVLSNLCALEGPKQSVEVQTSQGPHKMLRISIAPFEADSPETPGGRILIIEELAADAASPSS
jgi:PAS domain-containing protein